MAILAGNFTIFSSWSRRAAIFTPFFHKFRVQVSFPRRRVIPRTEFSFLRSNVSVQGRRTLYAVTLERLVRIFILAVHSSHPKLLSARRCTFVQPCPAAFIIRSERQRSPDGAPCATYGATPCWDSFFIVYYARAE